MDLENFQFLKKTNSTLNVYDTSANGFPRRGLFVICMFVINSKYRVATGPGKSWKVLESPGIDFSPGKWSWKTIFLVKSFGKVLEVYFSSYIYFLKF